MRLALERRRPPVGIRKVVAMFVVPLHDLTYELPERWPVCLPEPFDVATVVVGSPVAMVDVMLVGVSWPRVIVVDANDRSVAAYPSAIRVDVRLNLDVVI